jgi:hypothetical protein
VLAGTALSAAEQGSASFPKFVWYAAALVQIVSLVGFFCFRRVVQNDRNA